MAVPENHLELIEVIMYSASRFRGMAHSQLGHMKGIQKVLDNLMPYLYNGDDSPIITACGRYMGHPTGIGFYNIITATRREPALMLYIELYQQDVKLPEPAIKWALE